MNKTTKKDSEQFYFEIISFHEHIVLKLKPQNNEKLYRKDHRYLLVSIETKHDELMGNLRTLFENPHLAQINSKALTKTLISVILGIDQCGKGECHGPMYVWESFVGVLISEA